MTWNERLLEPADLQAYWPKTTARTLRVGVQALLAQQFDTWPMLRESVSALAEVETRTLRVRGAEVQVQFNPKRIVSTAAAVDAAAIQKRPCFLCVENLPPEEKGIAFGEEYVALCNPFPVLPGHLVIASRTHRPQTIRGAFDAFLALTAELGEGWFTVYNGPRCGASAPDHLHFQACAAEYAPVLRDLETWESRDVVHAGAVESFALRGYRLNLLAARSRDRAALCDWFARAERALAEATASEVEPMLNLIAVFGADAWTVVCYPRGRHRPACYYAEGEARLTVSPAAIDLSGVLVVPHPDHFARISTSDLESIHAEVTLDDALFGSWLDRLRATFA
ncbi:MAG: DUF4922 domain-containing protein [Blastocatellia bacterium]|nr:DUF4922 domain-containing protein [Blastocatellia bacterium]